MLSAPTRRQGTPRAAADVVGKRGKAIDDRREIEQVSREAAMQDRGSLAEAGLGERRVVGLEDDPKQPGLARMRHPQECRRRQPGL